jgi:hypothetical protein
VPRLQWDASGEHLYETGLDRGVLYVGDNAGVVWNGLVSLDEKSSGGTSDAFYIDGERYLNIAELEEFGATLTAFTYPDEFMVCDGTQPLDNGLFVMYQPRKPFGLTYRTLIGSDEAGSNLGYRIHVLYNCLAAPSERNNQTLTDSPSMMNFSWDLTALPTEMTGFRPSAHVMIDTTIAHPGAVSDAENILYGSVTSAARLPTFSELIEIFEENATLRITDHGDGSWTALTADTDTSIITFDEDDPTIFTITWDSAVITGADTYTLTSL